MPPCWESKSDWEIFKAIATKFSELAAVTCPTPCKDLVAVPLQHDTPDEMAQPEIMDWARGECEPIPGKTMPAWPWWSGTSPTCTTASFPWGPWYAGTGWPPTASSGRWRTCTTPHGGHARRERWGGACYPIAISEVVDAANAILYLAPETNGEVAYRAFKAEEKKTGVTLADLAEPYRGVTMSFSDLVQQPRRFLTSPCWSGIVNNGRAYTGFALNVERLVPWRTLTGRQHLYLDHQLYIEFGENLPTYKAKPGPWVLNELEGSQLDSGALLLNSSRPTASGTSTAPTWTTSGCSPSPGGCEPFWMNDLDAERIGIVDNDWVEVYNDNGVGGHPGGGERPDPEGHGHLLPRAGADDLRAEVALPGQQAGRRAQQPHPGAARSPC